MVVSVYGQVVLLHGCIGITEVVHRSAYSGLYRQVVLIQGCIGITEVVHGSAYSGLYRQVVLIQGCIQFGITELCMDQPTVVSLDRWSFCTSGL